MGHDRVPARQRPQSRALVDPHEISDFVTPKPADLRHTRICKQKDIHETSPGQVFSCLSLLFAKLASQLPLNPNLDPKP